MGILETWLSEGGFDGFSVTPFCATSLNSALVQATELGIPLINIDELIPADGREGITLSAQIASNNVRGGSPCRDGRAVSCRNGVSGGRSLDQGDRRSPVRMITLANLPQ